MRRFVAEPDAEFDFYLADRLRMTVAELRSTMSNAEWMGWAMFHARRRQATELERLKGEAAMSRGGAG